jgi:hypothetical protein
MLDQLRRLVDFEVHAEHRDAPSEPSEIIVARGLALPDRRRRPHWGVRMSGAGALRLRPPKPLIRL